MATLTGRLPDEKHARLKALAKNRARPLIDSSKKWLRSCWLNLMRKHAFACAQAKVPVRLRVESSYLNLESAVDRLNNLERFVFIDFRGFYTVTIWVRALRM